jgi:hypothetical protein
VVNPHGRVNENHRPGPGRRLGMGRNSGSVPPRAARRLAAPRAIKASKPARTKAVFSSMPVSCLAR